MRIFCKLMLVYESKCNVIALFVAYWREPYYLNIVLILPTILLQVV